MRNDKITNTTLRDLDWAQHDRVAMLRSLRSSRRVHAAAAAPSGWGTDVAGGDRRCVRAFLDGKGDARTAWWNLFSWAYLELVSGADLERAMYAFHRMHHALTLARLEFNAAVIETAGHIERDGVFSTARQSALNHFNR